VRQFGLDIVFFEGTADRLGELDGESKPIATRLFEEICGDSTARCTAATLENAAAGVLDYVDSIQ
jgi:hypothetical protein